MSEQKAVIIKKNEYIETLEKDVKRYMALTEEPKKITKPVTRTVQEYYSDPTEMLMWTTREIERCIKGHNGLTPKMYFFYNYCFILDIKRGNILPDFRQADNNWFDALQHCKDHTGEGLICVKRRRVGASWKEASDVLHDAMFNPYYHVGMNSKTEKDSVELFRKVKHIYSHLPDWLRATSTAGNTAMSMDFSYYTKDAVGNRIKKGTQSAITVKAPTVTAFEGLMLQKWVCDEAGKIGDLLSMYSMTEPCLMAGPVREGMPVIFGTSGEIGREGAGLKFMWDRAETYRFHKFFYAGFNGLIMDEMGNDIREEGIRWIVYERFRKRNLDPRQYNDFIQQYPLTTDEAFSQSLTGGLGDPVKINEQLSSIHENPYAKTPGWMKIDRKTDMVKHVPDLQGECIVYEPPKEGETYIAGCDPADHDNVTEEASDLSMYVIKVPKGTAPPQIVFEYTDRPQYVKEYFTQAARVLEWYNNAKILIESNRYAMIAFFQENGLQRYLQPSPQGLQRLILGQMKNAVGIRMTTDVKEYLEDLIESYIHDYCDTIPSEGLLKEFKQYGAVNTDKVMAFGIALIFLKEYSTIRNKRMTAEGDDGPLHVPKFGFKKVNGRIVRYNRKTQTNTDPLGLAR